MADKKLKVRVQSKHDTAESWGKATNFKPLAGEIIIYDPDETHPIARQKIGDGETLVNDLPFVDQDCVKTADLKPYLTGGSQTSTSTADGGSNVFTFTKSDGTSAAFTVKNGTKGSTGAHINSVTGDATPAAGNTVTYTMKNTDGTTAGTFKVVNGTNGSNGSNGTSVTVSSTTYQASSSNTTIPTGTWSSSVVSAAAGQYLWTKVTFSDGKVAYTVARQGSNGTNGTNGTNGVAAGFGTPTASVDANVGTPSVTVTASGADTAKVFNFAFKNLKGQKGDNGSAATVEVGTVTTGAAGSSASVTNAGTTSAAKFNFTIPRGNTGAAGTRGSRWSAGTAITGTSTTATIFSGTGITDALVNDMYLNTSTGYTYRCTVAGAASVAKWVYTGSIKGATGASGTGVVTSLNGSSTTGRSCYAPTTAGTSGYFLKSNGSGAPTWSAVSIDDGEL